MLFFETALSENQSKSCSSCHDPRFAFSDGYKRSVGITGDIHNRNAPSLINSKFLKYYTYGDNSIVDYMHQMEGPMYSLHPLEMGIYGNIPKIIKRLKENKNYRSLFHKVYGDSTDTFTITNIQNAIAAYESTLVSFGSPFDRFQQDSMIYPMNSSEKRGWQLFQSDSLACITCHTPPYFSVAYSTQENIYFNIGLYDYELNQNPSHDNGLYDHTCDERDKGKFRVPSLRNVEFTAPYMHDGSVNTLAEVIDIYTKGGRNTLYDNYYNNGIQSKNKDPRIRPHQLSATDKQDLINFLYMLSDSSIFANNNFINPHQNDSNISKAKNY